MKICKLIVLGLISLLCINWTTANEQVSGLSAQENSCGKLEIIIHSDGSLRSTKLLETTGNPEVDAKMIKSVKDNAPFKPFSKEIAKERDVVKLIRIFCSDKNGNLVNNKNGSTKRIAIYT